MDYFFQNKIIDHGSYSGGMTHVQVTLVYVAIVILVAMVTLVAMVILVAMVTHMSQWEVRSG